MTNIFLPNPAGLISYKPARIPHHESVEFALEYLGLEGRNVDIVVDWFFPLEAGMSWVALMKCAGTIFLFRQDVVKHLNSNRRKYSTPKVKVLWDAWTKLASWPSSGPNIDPEDITIIREWLDDDGEWVDLVEWYKGKEVTA